MGSYVLITGGIKVDSGNGSTLSKKTTDGVTFQTLPPSPIRQRGEMVYHEGAIYLIGGISTAGLFAQDVWKTEDAGQSWVQVTDDLPFTISKYSSFRLYSVAGKIWFAFDIDTGTNGGTWSSPDGLTWTQVSTNVTLPYYGVDLLKVGNDVYLIGGNGTSDNYSNQIYKTTNGINWVLQGTANWSPRSQQQLVYGNNTFYMLGGTYYSEYEDAQFYYNELWTSTDAVTWTKRATPPADISLYEYQFYFLNNQARFLLQNDGYVYSLAQDLTTWTKSASYDQDLYNNMYSAMTWDEPVAVQTASINADGLIVTDGRVLIEALNPSALLISIAGQATSNATMTISALTPLSFQMGASSNSDGQAVCVLVNVNFYTLEGTVTLSGNPIAGAKVVAVSDDLSSMYQTVTDSNGLYSLLCYQAGQYSLFVTYQNALGNRFTSDVKPFLSVGE